MFRTNYILYVFGLVLVLLFAAACDCGDDNHPQQQEAFSMPCIPQEGVPVQTPDYVLKLANGQTISMPGLTVVVGKVECPPTTNSPIWANSSKPVNAAPAGSQANSIRGRRTAGPGPGMGAYLPQAVLNLPFGPRGTETPPTACDPAQPDVLVVNHNNAAVNRVKTCPFQVTGTIRVVTRPLQIAIAPDGATAYVTSFDNAINFIDIATNKVTFTLQLPGSFTPNGIAITPDGNIAYITNFTTNSPTIGKIDLNSRTLVQTFPARGAYPQNAFISPDGAHLYVTYPYNNIVSVIDTLTNTEAAAISVLTPRGIDFNSKGTRAYIASASGSSGTLVEYNTDTFQVANRYNVGIGPNDVGMFYGDQYVLTVNYEGQSFSTVDVIAGTAGTIPSPVRSAGLAILR